MTASLRDYYQLTKPGIVYGNLLTAAAGYLFAAGRHPRLGPLAAVLAGTALVIASACVVNNFLDRDLDRRMERTRHRALASGRITPRAALVYAAILGSIGLVILSALTNQLVVIIGLIAFADYVILYAISKRRGAYGTLVGSISGSAPIVAGYVTATGRFDTGAWLLFVILTVWQMPHFYAIALYRRADYASAGLPVLPLSHGSGVAKQRTIVYVASFIAANLGLFLTGQAGWTYLVIVTGAGLAWLALGLRRWQTPDELWGRQMFGASLFVLLGLSMMLALNGYLI